MSIKINMIGKKFDKLTVIKEISPHVYPSGETRRKFECLCDCGNTTDITINNLRTGKTHSCGCWRKEVSSKLLKTHGLTSHNLHNVWALMKTRCYNEKSDRYKDYGARGIVLCTEWKDDFLAFYKWAISNGWSQGLFIDRIDNDDIYSPINCRFVNYGESARNTRLIRANNKSGYRGVCQKSNRWNAEITQDKKRYHVGYFNTPEAAAHAYDIKAIELNAGHPLNFPTN